MHALGQTLFSKIQILYYLLAFTCKLASNLKNMAQAVNYLSVYPNKMNEKQSCHDQVLPVDEHPRGRREQADRCQAPRLCCGSVHWLHPLQDQPAGYVKQLLKNKIVKRYIHSHNFSVHSLFQPKLVILLNSTGHSIMQNLPSAVQTICETWNGIHTNEFPNIGSWVRASR